MATKTHVRRNLKFVFFYQLILLFLTTLSDWGKLGEVDGCLSKLKSMNLSNQTPFVIHKDLLIVKKFIPLSCTADNFAPDFESTTSNQERSKVQGFMLLFIPRVPIYLKINSSRRWYPKQLFFFYICHNPPTDHQKTSCLPHLTVFIGPPASPKKH